MFDSAFDRLHSLLVQDVMARTVVWVSTRQPMADIAGLFRKHAISSAPVVDEQGVCVGILSATDFLSRDAERTASQVPPHHHPPVWLPDDVAATYMSQGVQTVPATSPLLHAARVMCMQHVHRLPVVDCEGRPVGIISTMDVVSALLKALSEQEAAV